MDKNKNLVIALIIASMVVFSVICYFSYSKNGEVSINGSGEPQQQEQAGNNNFKGPTGEPYIKGPVEPPPTSE